MRRAPDARETPGAYAARDGLIERDPSRVRRTPFGRLHSNTLFAELSLQGG